MIQFSEAEVKRLRAKAKKEPYVIALLQEQSKHIFKNPIIIPDKGIANWGLYYYCKKCSVALSFDRQQPFSHVCPSCNTVYTGEPFDS
ncbi:MAG: Heparinase family protein, partial [Clostridia bacterium]|nr:Heparinase family protein [Clostridia bacterium]